MIRCHKDDLANWLEGFRWDFWATPTFRYPKNHQGALAAVEQWLVPFQPHVYAAVAYERGSLGDRLHVHAVIGGIGRHPLRRTLLRQSWRVGLIEVKLYNPKMGGIRYMLDEADNPDTLQILGDPLPFRKRKRGGAQRRHKSAIEDINIVRPSGVP